jgi:hypothetical protein
VAEEAAPVMAMRRPMEALAVDQAPAAAEMVRGPAPGMAAAVAEMVVPAVAQVAPLVTRP